MEPVANFIMGPLTSNKNEADAVYLLNSETLSNTNHELVVKFIVDSLNALWEGKLFKKGLQLYVTLTDASAYM